MTKVKKIRLEQDVQDTLDVIDTTGTGSKFLNDAWNYEEVGGGSVSDETYNESTWDGVTDVAPSKNAVRDKIESMIQESWWSLEFTVVPDDLVYYWPSSASILNQSWAIEKRIEFVSPVTGTIRVYRTIYASSTSWYSCYTISNIYKNNIPTWAEIHQSIAAYHYDPPAQYEFSREISVVSWDTVEVRWYRTSAQWWADVRNMKIAFQYKKSWPTALPFVVL